ncbi:site-specific integrase [Deminuibacter soli]|uniref:Tyr recombinase domain-containing protein n=1 Tax=Deminuibacter soli TaxID=2291815 RepID=A0A3E1NGB0_9BACT|nr:site-specific integrase [Deminuibacter soli]RFM27003.1 hypothetical protein DXN05_16105 [Deminuibacter soli]
MKIGKRKSDKGDRYIYYYDLGRDKGQRPQTGDYTWVKPKTPAERQHNKVTLELLKVKESNYVVDQQAIGTGYVPPHRLKANFLDFYAEYAKDNATPGNRHLSNSLTQLQLFLDGKNQLAPIAINEDFCKRFRAYLKKKFTGDTPSNYFSRFKQVLKAAAKAGYFKDSPAEEVAAQSTTSKRLKNFLEAEDYVQLLQAPITNYEVQEAFIFCIYTGLRFVDIGRVLWTDIANDTLTTRIIQKKTGFPLVLALHPIAKGIIVKRLKTIMDGPEEFRQKKLASTIFALPSANGCNKILKTWMERAGLQKSITWSCARLSFSILLQDARVDNATVALLLGHTTTHYVNKTYKRHRPKDQMENIGKLPSPEVSPYFLLIDQTGMPATN